MKTPRNGSSVMWMRNPALLAAQAGAVLLALLRGVPEFASLQRWRFKAWMGR